MTDVPDGRKRHSGKVPICGVTIALGVFAGLAYVGSADRTTLSYAVAALILLAMGLLDDRRGLFCFLRLFGQIFAASIVACSGIPLVSLPGDGVWPLELMLTVAFLVATVNAINFLDGADGLAGGCAPR